MVRLWSDYGQSVFVVPSLYFKDMLRLMCPSINRNLNEINYIFADLKQFHVQESLQYTVTVAYINAMKTNFDFNFDLCQAFKQQGYT